MEIENMAKSTFILNKLKLNYQSVLLDQKLELDIQQSNRFSLPNSNQITKIQNSDIYITRFLSNSKRFNIQYSKKDPTFLEAIKYIENKSGMIKVIGNIFKAMKLKPKYFQQYTQIKISENQFNENTCYLEDKSSRIKLQITNCKLCLPNKTWKEIKVEDLITGILVLIEGEIIGNNLVNVEKIYLPDLIDPPIQNPLNQTTYVCLISGINYDKENDFQKLRHLIQYLKGNLYSSYGNDISQNLSQIIIVGNLYGKQGNTKDCLTGSLQKVQDFKQLYSSIQENIKNVDELINEFVSICPVAIMPGQNEPVSQMLPQPPLQKAHFGESFENSPKVTFLTNPTEFTFGNLKFLGTSGQNIEDLIKYQPVKNQSDIDFIEMSLFYGHIAPTLQDTLIQQQQFQIDPFVMEQFPNVYFVGNMKTFDTKMLSNNLRIISIPSFSSTGTVAILNLSTFECFSFQIQ